ncbi:MAG: hypothetical protein ACRDJM_02670 [Actinomycetota bacterium]
MKKAILLGAAISLLALPAVVWGQTTVAGPFNGGAAIASPGIKMVPCGAGMPGGSCPSFSWNGSPLWNTTSGSLTFASCGGNIHQSTMNIGGAAVSYTGVCVGLLCQGGGPWGSGAFGAGLVFSVTPNQGAQCFNVADTPFTDDDDPGFTAATFSGVGAGAR